jgi:hypothetical protein
MTKTITAILLTTILSFSSTYARESKQAIMDKLFLPGKWLDVWQSYDKVHAKFGCEHYYQESDESHHYTCIRPTRADIATFKTEFLNRAQYNCDVYAQIKKLSYEDYSAFLESEASQYQSIQGNNAYSEMVFKLAAQVNTAFDNEDLQKCIYQTTDATFIQKLFSELDNIGAVVDRGISDNDFADLVDHLRDNSPSLNAIKYEGWSLNINLSAINDIDKAFDYSFYKTITGKMKTNNCDNLLPEKTFFFVSNRSENNLLDIAKKQDREIIKQLITGKNQWTVNCEKVGKFALDFKKKFTVNNKTQIINLPFKYKTTCHWWNCEGETYKEWVTVPNDIIVEKLRDAIK